MEKPLLGRKIVITRSQEDFEPTAQEIRHRGGIPISSPMITLCWPEDTQHLDQAIQQIRDYDWLFFTSVHSVHFFMQRVERFAYPRSILEKNNLAAIGESTANSLKEWKLNPRFVAEKSTGKDFCDEFRQSNPIHGKRFLLPVSNIARKTVPNCLQKAGGIVTCVTAYCNKPVDAFQNDVLNLFENMEIDWVLFFSSSAVNNFYRLFHEQNLLHAFRTASIGPSTSASLRTCGNEPTVEASQHNLNGLLDALVDYEQSFRQ